MLYYKIDVWEKLRSAGYNTVNLRKNKILGEKTLQYLRENKMVGITTIEVLCDLLDLQPGDIIGFRKG